MKMSIFFLISPFFFMLICIDSGAGATVHNRRTLHQPFFPLDLPGVPPSSSDVQFTPNPTNTASPPFFLSFPSPPPPPPSASFPANISSLSLPSNPKSKPVSSTLIATAVTLVIAAAIAVAIVVYFRARKGKWYDHDSRSFNDEKPHRSDSSSRITVNCNINNNNNNRIPKLNRPSESSAEFLYLGTLVNSHGGIEIDATNASFRHNYGSILQKMDSPELLPLPPLGGGERSQSNLRNNNNFENLEVESSKEEEFDKFYSPELRPSAAVPPPPPPPPQPLVSPIVLSPENQENIKTLKPKLKPLHWDKVRASSDRETVWDQLKSSSFKLNEEMIQTLFLVKTTNSSNSNETSGAKHSFLPMPIGHENRVLDPKKSQNIAILLRALNVTVEEVCDALLEGNVETLGTELLESLIKMAPTKEEERKLKAYKDDIYTPVKLGPAEKFLKAVLDIPFAFKRIDAMLYISNFDSEVEYLKRSFQTLELACDELRSSRIFLKLLEAVLKTGNRMNIGTFRGDAHAFKLDTLLKLIDIKSTDQKTTLLHFVVQQIIKSEQSHFPTNQISTVAINATCHKLGLQVISNITSELSNIKKAASMDSEVLNSEVMKLSKGISDISQVVKLIDNKSMNEFMKKAEEEIIRVKAQESVALSLVKEITEYFHGTSVKEEVHPFRIFTVVRDFLTVLDRVCKEVSCVNEGIVIGSSHKFPVPINPNGFLGKRRYSLSDDEFDFHR